jgi:hypothetical protein
MSYTFCEKCDVLLWWKEVEYEEVDGLIYCFECTNICDECQQVFVYDHGDCVCDMCMTSIQERE